MAIQVVFRGIMLFSTDAGYLMSAVLPSTRRNPPGSSDKDKHCDGTKATPHYTKLVHWTPGGSTTCDITDAQASLWTGSSPRRLPSNVVAPFAHLANPKGTAHEPLLYVPRDDATVVDLGFDTLPTASVSFPRQAFRMAPYGPILAYVLSLNFDSTSLSIHVSTMTGPIEVKDGEIAYICNFDDDTPTKDKLEAEKPILGHKQRLVDDDFKWLYGLVEPFSGSFGDWAGTRLPAPEWRRDHRDGRGRTVSVSTCFPGWI